jgi:signal transduction histidine kinase
MELHNTLLIFSCLISFLLGLFIVISNPRKAENRVLSAFMFAIFFWLLTNLLTNLSQNIEVALLFARATIIGPVVLSFLFFVFAKIFTTKNKIKANYFVASFVPAFIILLSTPTKYNIESVSAFGNDTKVGFIYTLLIPLILIYIGLGLILLRRFYKATNDNLRKTQVRYIYFGIIAAVVPGVIINAILPLFENYSANLYGPNVIILLAIFMTIAIVRHKLLDIRMVVARTVTYVLLLGVILLVYGLLIFGLGSRLLPRFNLNTLEKTLFVTSTVIIALSYQPLKLFFNKFTNKIFFQDAYDSQDVLDKISSVIVGNVDPHKVQLGVEEILSDALRPMHVSLILYGSGHSLSAGDSMGIKWNKSTVEKMQTLIGTTGKKFTLYDELTESEKKLKSFLGSQGVSAISPLVTRDEIIGYLVLGQKRSGNTYNSQDITLLNIASNELAVALQNAQRFDEIQSFNKTLQDKVTEATRELKVTNRKLIQLDEAKDEFISMASHQLRTPLTSIKGYLSMVVEGDLGEIKPQQERVLKDAFGSSQRMAYLIADFLNVSRIKTGKFMIEKHEVDLPQIVQEEIRQLEEMAESRDLKLIYEKPGVFPRVKLDENKTRQVMMNMVDNAIYYTPSGGAITIQLYALADEIIFKVVDTGIGVPKKEQHKLFTKFFRAGNAKKARPDGTGLGLFMAQKVVVEQGGAVIFESTEGKGSTFGFRFPLKKIKA